MQDAGLYFLSFCFVDRDKHQNISLLFTRLTGGDILNLEDFYSFRGLYFSIAKLK